MQDPNLAKIMKHISERQDFRIVDGVLYFRDRLCVPNIDDLRNEIMAEAHCTKYSMHAGSINMYQNLKSKFWWNNMKRDSNFRVSMHDMSVDKGRASETSRPFIVIGDSAVEMGTSYDGCHLRFADYQQRKQCYLGYS